MINIKSISNEDEIHHYVLELFPDIHNELISFYYKLGFASDELGKLDVLFSELNGCYFHIKKGSIKVHFFIHNNEIHMVIDSDKLQGDLSTLMKDYFLFPQ